MWRPERPPGEQGGQLGGANCGIPGNGAQVLYSSHKDPKFHCPPSSPAGFCPAFSLGEEPGTAKDEGPEVSVVGMAWARGPVRDACMRESGRWWGAERRVSSGVGGQGLRGGLDWLQAGALGPLSLGPASRPG